MTAAAAAAARGNERRWPDLALSPAFLPTTLPNCYPSTPSIKKKKEFWNHCRSIALPQHWPPVIDVWSCRPALSPSHSGGDIILGVAWPAPLPVWLPRPGRRLSRGAGPLCCRSRSYRTLGCWNSAFVMAVISLLCSQVELRWNSTGSHCVPIFRTLKEICWVLKGWNEARRALADLALWGNTQWKHNGNNLVLPFPFVLCWTLVSAAHLLQPLFSRAALSHFSLPFPPPPLLRETQRLMRWQPRLCQSLGDPQGLLPASLQVLSMQIKFGMAAFRCDNYGFICKLSLLLMLRDIKISSNASIREDHICWRSTDSNNMWFSRHQRSVNKHSFRQPCALESPRRVQSRSKCLRENIYIFPFG